MRNLILPMFFGLSLLFSLGEARATGLLDEDFKSRLKAAKLKADDFGVFVADAEGTSYVSLNSDRLMIPASITKLVTAATFLRHYPPGTKFKTQLVSDATVKAGVLKGDLILKGAGDPGFVSETMWFLVNAFLRSNVRAIEGDIVVDDTLFDDLRFDPSRSQERVDRAYDAPIGAMSFNWNSVNVFVRPGNKTGDQAQVWIDPENEYVRLVGTVKTGGKSARVNIDRDSDGKTGKDIIRISGQVPAGSAEVVQFKNINRPDLWAGYNLKSFLSQRGIEIKGKVKTGKASDDAKVMAEAESKPVEELVTDMNKFSNNYVAEMLTKHLGLLREKPGKIQTGMKVIEDYLSEIGIAKSQIKLTNPSGLTRDNVVTAAAMWKVLHQIESDFRSWPEFASSLPISGIDGTLKKRMKDSGGERQVRGKTGLLDGVVALAGFAGKKSGKAVPFVFIYNGNADGSLVRSVIDRFVVEMIVNGSDAQKAN